MKIVLSDKMKHVLSREFESSKAAAASSSAQWVATTTYDKVGQKKKQ